MEKQKLISYLKECEKNIQADLDFLINRLEKECNSSHIVDFTKKIEKDYCIKIIRKTLEMLNDKSN